MPHFARQRHALSFTSTAPLWLPLTPCSAAWSSRLTQCARETRWIAAEREKALLGKEAGDGNPGVRHNEQAILSFGGGPRVCPGQVRMRSQRARWPRLVLFRSTEGRNASRGDFIWAAGYETALPAFVPLWYPRLASNVFVRPVFGIYYRDASRRTLGQFSIFNRNNWSLLT